MRLFIFFSLSLMIYTLDATMQIHAFLMDEFVLSSPAEYNAYQLLQKTLNKRK